MSIHCVWDWIISNLDALIVEIIGAIVIGLILWWRERRKWSPARREVAREVGIIFYDAFTEILHVSGLTSVDVLPRETMMEQVGDTARYVYTTIASFFEQQYERDFETKYHPALRQMDDGDLKTLAESMEHVLSNLSPYIDLGRHLFGAEAVAALLEVKGDLRWTQRLLYFQYLEDPGERDFSSVGRLASKMGRALTLVWGNVE